MLKTFTQPVSSAIVALTMLSAPVYAQTEATTPEAAASKTPAPQGETPTPRPVLGAQPVLGTDVNALGAPQAAPAAYPQYYAAPVLGAAAPGPWPILGAPQAAPAPYPQYYAVTPPGLGVPGAPQPMAIAPQPVPVGTVNPQYSAAQQPVLGLSKPTKVWGAGAPYSTYYYAGGRPVLGWDSHELGAPQAAQVTAGAVPILGWDSHELGAPQAAEVTAGVTFMPVTTYVPVTAGRPPANAAAAAAATPQSVICMLKPAGAASSDGDVALIAQNAEACTSVGGTVRTPEDHAAMADKPAASGN